MRVIVEVVLLGHKGVGLLLVHSEVCKVLIVRPTLTLAPIIIIYTYLTMIILYITYRKVQQHVRKGINGNEYILVAINYFTRRWK